VDCGSAEQLLIHPAADPLNRSAPIRARSRPAWTHSACASMLSRRRTRTGSAPNATPAWRIAWATSADDVVSPGAPIPAPADAALPHRAVCHRPDRRWPDLRSQLSQPGCLDAQVLTAGSHRPGRGGHDRTVPGQPGRHLDPQDAGGRVLQLSARSSYGPTTCASRLTEIPEYFGMCRASVNEPHSGINLAKSKPARSTTTRTATLQFFRPILRPGVAWRAAVPAQQSP